LEPFFVDAFTEIILHTQCSLFFEMVPKTRTGRKRDRRKIGKYLQEEQHHHQQQEDDVAPLSAKTETARAMGVTKERFMHATHDKHDSLENSSAHMGDDGKQHPPDCPCILRKLGKDLFLPPSMIDDTLNNNKA
jgi:hypothetical protein